MFHIFINICSVQSETLSGEHTVLSVLGKGVVGFGQSALPPTYFSSLSAKSIEKKSSKKIFLQYRNTRLA